MMMMTMTMMMTTTTMMMASRKRKGLMSSVLIAAVSALLLTLKQELPQKAARQGRQVPVGLLLTLMQVQTRAKQTGRQRRTDL